VKAASLALSFAIAMPGAAFGACPQELAVYAEQATDGGIDFTPVSHDAVMTHTFKMHFPENSVVLEAIVMTTEDVVRPHGVIMFDCPTGDVTGEELAACTIWEGPIYAVSDSGEAGLLPAQGQPAAKQLIFPGLAAFIRQSHIWGMTGLSKLPGDIFSMSGCQE